MNNDIKKEILTKLTPLLETFVITFIENNTITLETNLTNDLGLDSLDKMELILKIEREFNIVINDDEADKTYIIDTVGSIVDLIYSKIVN